MTGERAVVDVATRTVPERSLLCLKARVEGTDGAWALGKRFVAILRAHELARVDGEAGRTFCIYWGGVGEDGDGPLEWCRPVPRADAEALAAGLPELALRAEPAHEEAFVDLGPAPGIGPVQWQLVSEALRAWAEEHGRTPSALGVRLVYAATPPVTARSVPDVSFAVPLG